MRISCPKDDLLKHLQVVARGVSQRSSVQILSGVLIDASSPELPVAFTLVWKITSRPSGLTAVAL